jgi:hypothetical protein
MARSNDESPGAKKKPAPRRKATPRSKKASPAEKAPAAKRAPTRAAKNGKPAPRARKPAARAAATPPAAAKKPAAPRRPRGKAVAAEPAVPFTAPMVVVDVSEEERIEDAKYQPRERPPRAFEEERFLFPETYGENRVRLLVKDPEWLFAHWDVAPESLDGLRRDVGERTAALSRLTLRIRDPHHGGASVILLPEGVRSWYVKADHEPRAYRAELGFTLPSGEFRSLAESNTVRTPWAGSSGERPGRRVRFDGAPLDGAPQPQPPGADPRPGSAAVGSRDALHHGAPGPWTPEPATQIGGQSTPEAPASSGPAAGPGGASDVYRR